VRRFSTLGVLVVTASLLAIPAAASTPSYTITQLFRPSGDSEPAISVSGSGTIAISGLLWDRVARSDFVTNVWTGPFLSPPPVFQGPIDAALHQPGKSTIGGGDADVVFSSSGALQAATLIGLVNAAGSFKLGISAIRCANVSDPAFSIAASCSSQIIDTAGGDRPWITSDGAHVWIAYQDAGGSSLTHVQRSDDDGLTWRKVGDPIVGQGGATSDATHNNTAGPIVADPFTHNLYEVYAAGEPQTKCCSNDFNNIYVARSTDGGATWTSSLVDHDSPPARLNNLFPSLAVDETNGDVYAVWSSVSGTFVARSLDGGSSWSDAKAVPTSPVKTAVFPWVAARGGTVDIVYYGSSAISNDAPSAIWHVYLAKSTDGGNTYQQTTVDPTPNHIGTICTRGGACPIDKRTLLDLFEVAIDPLDGKAAIAYTDDNTPLQTSDGLPLSQVVLAQEN
jgi:hypothetical protein